MSGPNVDKKCFRLSDTAPLQKFLGKLLLLQNLKKVLNSGC